MKFIKIYLPIFMAFTLIFSALSATIKTSESISNKVLRLHILANSDSSEDQNVKLMLKNYLLDETSELFNGNNLEENINIAIDNTEFIRQICDEFLEKLGIDYNTTVSVANEYFETRVYDDFTLPAGNYEALKIQLGEGEGHNWWCIIFPSVCLSACSTSLDDYLSDEEMELVTSEYTPKFKIVEIYERIKNKTGF